MIEKIKKFFKNNSNVKSNNWNSDLDPFLKALKDTGYAANVIFDIGANKGNWSRKVHLTFPDAKIIMFEPQENLSIFKRDLLNKANIKLENIGISNYDGSMKMNILNRHDSATFRALSDDFKVVNQIEIPTLRLDTYILQNGIMPDVVKIDAEGCDLEVLEGAEQSLLNIEVILVEASVSAGFRNSVMKTLNFLEEKGFKLYDITDLNRNPITSNLVLVELAFIKKNGKIDSIVNTEKDYIRVVNNDL